MAAMAMMPCKILSLTLACREGCGRLYKAAIQVMVTSLRYQARFRLYVDEFNPSHKGVPRRPAMLLKADGVGTSVTFDSHVLPRQPSIRNDRHVRHSGVGIDRRGTVVTVH
jgi:hypothetical protein